MEKELNSILRSPLRHKLLQHFLLHPRASFYVRELAYLIREDAGNCSRELKKLGKAGLVKAVSQGNLKLYSLKETHPDLSKLREIFHLTQPARKTKSVIFIAGPNGSGKSTIAQEHIVKLNLPFVNADEIASKLSPGDFAKVRLRAGKSFLNQIQENIRQGKSFIVETTFAGRYWSKWIPLLKQNRYTLRTIYVFVADAGEAVLRIRVRVKKGGHPVPEEDIRRRFRRSKTNFWEHYRKDMDHWQMYLNSKDELTPVAFGSGEEVQLINEPAFRLFKEGMV